ncbi:arginine--tRNA ligase [uncultured Campylobacter sp.]|uniref:arginine--tRNA ligase n=1 Tax=uncultured Campylobacter sp. TaxID=218934 RepID=UPI00261AB5FE|nr:arginine--tRNA ligase [uncultured Campylobacter sp.]
MSAGELSEGGTLPPILLEEPPNKELGDFATNFAMQSARIFHQPPKKIAEILGTHITGSWLDHAEVAGPGFLNFYLKKDVIADTLRDILRTGENYGALPPKDLPPIQVEYVSANPTGPLHVGHGRGAAVGSALVKLLRKAGYEVQSEYYVNDAGKQMDLLAISVNARYLERLGQKIVFPENGYHGADIIDTAQRIIDRDGDRYLALSEEERLEKFKDIAYKEKLAVLREDLADFRVTFDRWFSERTLHPEAVQRVVDVLLERGTAYEKDGAVWLRSTDYGDDKDRVIFRDNGVPTYLAADIAYHDDKYRRGYGRLINIWGADHHGYIARLKAAVHFLGYDESRLEIILMQMVNLLKDGQTYKMSKRAGNAILMSDVLAAIGRDAMRFIFISKKGETPLEFDVDELAREDSSNPIFYINYAHARVNQIFTKAGKCEADVLGADFGALDEAGLGLAFAALSLNEILNDAFNSRGLQKLPDFLKALAADFHKYYNENRVVGSENEDAKLKLFALVALSIRTAFALMGLSAKEKM